MVLTLLLQIKFLFWVGGSYEGMGLSRSQQWLLPSPRWHVGEWPWESPCPLIFL